MPDASVLTQTKTTCPYCGVGCGMVVQSLADGTLVSVEGDPEHPANHGKLCSKGLTVGETLNDKERLLYPQIHGRRSSWAEATQTVADAFSNVIRDHGPQSVAFYVSGQILTEDYYVANKLMKGFIGSANIDTNSRLCMASSVAGHKRAFGADTVPGTYQDLDAADLVILTGSNFAWCHPVLYQRLLAAKEARPDLKILVIDPRRTATCDFADMHLAINPGSDVPLFLGLLNHLVTGGFYDRDYVAKHTNGFDEAVRAAAPWHPEAVERATGLDVAELQRFYTLFTLTEKTVTVYSQGVNQALDGTDRVNAIINCHLVTGRIGKAGMGPFSITGQPNAMGGREVGGLANQLACHMAIDNPDHRDKAQRFWKSPVIASEEGLKAVDLFNAVKEGTVKAVWIMATNPVASMPDAESVKAALKACDMVVVSDVMARTDTADCAHVLLPSTVWSEKQGMVTNSERRMSRQRAFRAPPGEARDDWRQFCDVAKAMGYGAFFDFETARDVFIEYAAMTGFENGGTRDLDLSGLIGLSAEEYRQFAPQQWPVYAEGDGNKAEKRFFADGGFFTSDRRAILVPVEATAKKRPDPAYPFILNTGRIRDQWHTMTRTGQAPTLFRHIAEPFVEIAPTDAEALGFEPADIAELTSPFGRALARVVITDRQREGSVFAPMHWTAQTARQSRMDALVAPITDPVSGQPALKSSGVSLRKFQARLFGFAALVTDEADLAERLRAFDYWAIGRTPLPAGHEGKVGLRLELATREPVEAQDWAEGLSDILAPNLERVSFSGGPGSQSALAFFDRQNLAAVFYFGPCPVAASRAWVLDRLGKPADGIDRYRLLAGVPGQDMPDTGATICTCMNVGALTIKAAIKSGAITIPAVSAKTSAGTSCGSCRSDIVRLIKEETVHA